MQGRPSQKQLETFAGLITKQDDSHCVPPSLDPSELDHYIQALDYHGITMLALQNNTLPKAIVKRLKSRKAMMVANEALKQQALCELFESFDNAGLTRNILFKGSALAYTVYEHPWLRPRSDSDCLIDQSEYADFVQIFEQLGYQKLFAIEGRHLSYQQTFSKPLAGKSVINIDLHWRINNRQTLARLFNVSELIKSSEPLHKLSDVIKVPSTIDSLLIASLHRLGHHHNEERLTWLWDIHLLASQFKHDDWQMLCTKATDKQMAAITLDALQYCRRLFGLKIPGNTNDALSNAAQTKEPSQLFLSRDLSEWQYFIKDIKALSGLRNKLELLIENLFPSPAYIRQQMGTKSAALGYLKRIARGVRRITR